MKEKFITRLVYLSLGTCAGLVIMMSFIYINQNKNEANNAKINYQYGCFFIATKIVQKYDIKDYDFQKNCVLSSSNLEQTYLDLSEQMDKIKGY